MQNHEQKYYLCKSGEVKRRAEEQRTTFIRLREQLWQVIKSFSTDRASVCDQMMLIRGLVFKGEPPDLWTKPRHGISYPKRGTLPPDVRKYFTPSGNYQIKTHEELKSFGAWLGCPFSYHYKTKTGSGHKYKRCCLNPPRKP